MDSRLRGNDNYQADANCSHSISLPNFEWTLTFDELSYYNVRQRRCAHGNIYR